MLQVKHGYIIVKNEVIPINNRFFSTGSEGVF